MAIIEQNDRAIFDAYRDGLKALAGAWAAHAEPVLDAEQRAVGGAKKVVTLAIEEAIRQKIERRADMWTGIDVGMEISVLAHDKDRSQIGS